ncbi:hypothetical protein [Aeromonas jandaei]|uniref:hypothetical protein n=1 Tax=Aeromonas jandaei TaxID=650 RepID=UPI001ABFC382|nr:hypothetical protein [Aeromonas jandaei]QSR73539.1 hypothetical protein GP488_14380 [Aeromonas jandaei]
MNIKSNMLAELERVRQDAQSKQPEQPEQPVKKESKQLNPHLALCHADNPSANNRHSSLMIKSKDDPTIGLVNLVKSEHEAMEFEDFCKSINDQLPALYEYAKENGILEEILKSQTQQQKQ